MVAGIAVSVGLLAHFVALMSAYGGEELSPVRRWIIRITAVALPFLPYALFLAFYPSGRCADPCNEDGFLSAFWFILALFLAAHLFRLTRAEE